MARKELQMGIKLDTKEFDRAISDMQKKLRELYAPSDMMRMQQQTAQRLQGMGMGGIMSAPSQEAYRQSTQQPKRELEKLIRDEALAQERLGKEISKRLELIKELRTQQQSVVKGSEDELKIKQQIARVEENNFRSRELYKQRDVALNQMIDAKEQSKPQGIARLLQAYRGGGIGGVATAAGRMFTPLGGIGAISAIGAAAGSALALGSEVYRGFGRAPVGTQVATGKTVGGTIGRQLQDIYSGNAPFEALFAGERAQAAQAALKNYQMARTADQMALGGGLLKSGAVGMGAGALIGAKIGGTAAGIVTLGLGAPAGAAVGAGVGGAIGALGGAGVGAMSALGNERQRALLLSPISKTMDQRYQSILAEQLVNDYESVLEAQKQQNPLKTIAIEEYKQNFRQNLQAQRGMGLGYEGFYGESGLLQQAANAGFTRDLALGMSGDILAAGGSTRVARESTLGLQLQRNFDLTNAGQVLGTLSGGLGGAELTKQATIKILAEGTKLGLDDSKFVEENRRFTQAASEVIARSGARSEVDIDRLSERFSSMLTERTSQGVEAAKNAYERYQQLSTEVTGRKGMMRAAGMLQSAEVGELFRVSGGDVVAQALMHIPENQMTEDHPVVRQAARLLNKPPSEVVKGMEKITMGAVSPITEVLTLRKTLQQRQKETGVTMSRETYGQAPKDMQEMYDQLSTLISLPGMGMDIQDPRQLEAFMKRFIAEERPGELGPYTTETAIKNKLAREATETGRIEDTTIKDLAESSKVVLDNFRGLKDELVPTAEALEQFTVKIRELAMAISTAQTPEERRRIATEWVKEQAKPAAKNQSQATKGRQ
jgi:hypothetical protein